MRRTGSESISRVMPLKTMLIPTGRAVTEATEDCPCGDAIASDKGDTHGVIGPARFCLPFQSTTPTAFVGTNSLPRVGHVNASSTTAVRRDRERRGPSFDTSTFDRDLTDRARNGASADKFASTLRTGGRLRRRRAPDCGAPRHILEPRSSSRKAHGLASRARRDNMGARRRVRWQRV